VIDLPTLQRIYDKMSEYGEVRIQVGAFEADIPAEVADVPGAVGTVVVDMRAQASDPSAQVTRLAVSGAPPSISWWGPDDAAAAVVEDIQLIVRAAVGPWWKRWVAIGLMVVATVAVLVGIPRLQPGSNDDHERWMSVATVVLSGLAGVATGVIAAAKLKVRVTEPSGAWARIKEKWPDWVFGGVVAGLLVFLLQRLLS
jgi:hypothetical protein